MNFEEAKKKAEIEANKVEKIIMRIQENNDYWFFEAGLPNERFFDDGAGSMYINKKDGTIIPMHLWKQEIQELNAKFKQESKTVYDYYDEQGNKDKIVIPDSLKEFVYIDNGKVVAMQKIPKELENEFIKLESENVNMNNEFKINNNIVFEDEETKVEYQKYLDEINEYNRKVANGEKPETDLSEIMSKFKEKFNVEGAENTHVENKNLDELMEKLNQSLDSNYTNTDLTIDEQIENIDKRIEELNKLEDNDI